MATRYCWELEGQHRELSFETKPPVPTTQDLIRWQCCRTLAYNKFYAILQGIPNCQTHVRRLQANATHNSCVQTCLHSKQQQCKVWEPVTRLCTYTAVWMHTYGGQPSLDEDQEDGRLWIPTTFRGGFRWGEGAQGGAFIRIATFPTLENASSPMCHILGWLTCTVIGVDCNTSSMQVYAMHTLIMGRHSTAHYCMCTHRLPTYLHMYSVPYIQWTLPCQTPASHNQSVQKSDCTNCTRISGKLHC